MRRNLQINLKTFYGVFDETILIYLKNLFKLADYSGQAGLTILIFPRPRKFPMFALARYIKIDSHMKINGWKSIQGKI